MLTQPRLPSGDALEGKMMDVLVSAYNSRENWTQAQLFILGNSELMGVS